MQPVLSIRNIFSTVQSGSLETIIKFTFMRVYEVREFHLIVSSLQNMVVETKNESKSTIKLLY